MKCRPVNKGLNTFHILKNVFPKQCVNILCLFYFRMCRPTRARVHTNTSKFILETKTIKAYVFNSPKYVHIAYNMFMNLKFSFKI